MVHSSLISQVNTPCRNYYTEKISDMLLDTTIIPDVANIKKYIYVANDGKMVGSPLQKYYYNVRHNSLIVEVQYADSLRQKFFSKLCKQRQVRALFFGQIGDSLLTVFLGSCRSNNIEDIDMLGVKIDSIPSTIVRQQKLNALSIGVMGNYHSLSFLSGLDCLRHLRFSLDKGVELDLSVFNELNSLKTLEVFNYGKCLNAEQWTRFENLEFLEMNIDLNEEANLNCIRRMTSLKGLAIKFSNLPQDISKLAFLNRLTRLEISCGLSYDGFIYGKLVELLPNVEVVFEPQASYQ
jgi:hypothetical protein